MSEQDALARGMELLNMKRKDLPPLARDFADHLCQQVGMCMEVFLTAYAVYAQCVENLECSDDWYSATEEHKDWFRQRQAFGS